MALRTPTYRYGIVVSGANYAPGDVNEPQHVIMVHTLDAAAAMLEHVRDFGTNVYWAEMGNGAPMPDMPNYGEPGDGALVYRVQRDHPDFSEVLDMPGDRARHAYLYLAEEPSYRFTFGPRRGLTRERIA